VYQRISPQALHRRSAAQHRSQGNRRRLTRPFCNIFSPQRPRGRRNTISICASGDPSRAVNDPLVVSCWR
jgi:hypothetical protein